MIRCPGCRKAYRREVADGGTIPPCPSCGGQSGKDDIVFKCAKPGKRKKGAASKHKVTDIHFSKPDFSKQEMKKLMRKCGKQTGFKLIKCVAKNSEKLKK